MVCSLHTLCSLQPDCLSSGHFLSNGLMGSDCDLRFGVPHKVLMLEQGLIQRGGGRGEIPPS